MQNTLTLAKITTKWPYQQTSSKDTNNTYKLVLIWYFVGKTFTPRNRSSCQDAAHKLGSFELLKKMVLTSSCSSSFCFIIGVLKTTCKSLNLTRWNWTGLLYSLLQMLCYATNHTHKLLLWPNKQSTHLHICLYILVSLQYPIDLRCQVGMTHLNKMRRI